MIDGLTSEQARDYREQGFVYLPGFVSAAELQAYRDAAEALRERVRPIAPGRPRLQVEKDPDGDAMMLRQVEPLIDLIPEFEALSRDPRVRRAVEQALGEPGVLFEDKLNYKPARVGSAFPPHQDLSYWKGHAENLTTLFIYLDEANERNGCMRLIPGSHKLGLLEWVREGGNKIVSPAIEGMDEVVAGGAAGDALLFHCLTVHTSEPNRSDTGRRAIILTYNAASEGNHYRYSEELLASYH